LRRRLVALLLAALSVGCGDSLDDSGTPALEGAGGSAGSAGGAGGAVGDGGFDGEGTGGQGGPPPYFDASPDALTNNPIEQLFANPERSPWDFLGTDSQDAQGYLDAAEACYAEPRSCEAPGCASFASCCVASGSCCAPVIEPAIPESIDFTLCAGQTLDSCAAGDGLTAAAFGPEEPVLTERGLVPNGSPSAEGGVLIGESVDLASKRILVELQFSLPVGCDGTCLESAGLAFTVEPAAGGFGGVEIGLLLSGSREVVNLIIGGQVADSFDAGDDDTLWLMALTPSGMVTVERDGVLQGAHPFATESLRNARLAIFGRNLAGDADSAAVARIATQSELCDNPRGWTNRMPISVTVGGSADPRLMMGREPSIAEGPQYTAAALEIDGQIFIGEEASAGQLSFGGPVAAAAVIPTEPFEAGGVGDPELFWMLDTLYLFYTAFDQNGSGSVGSALVEDGAVLKRPEPVLVPEGAVVSYEAPTIHLRDGLALMMVRATLQSGATELHAFYSADPETGWARIVDGTLEELTRIEDPSADLTSPSLIVHNSAYHLYYARRTGTRWAIELAVSDELLLWRPLGEALGASGASFDSLGARGADARSLSDRVELLYMGQDGVSFQLGIASRGAPSTTALQ
jgi:hypothetical protein